MMSFTIHIDKREVISSMLTISYPYMIHIHTQYEQLHPPTQGQANGLNNNVCAFHSSQRKQ